MFIGIFRFLGHVNSFTTLSFSYRLGYTTVRKIVYKTIEIIWKKLSPIVMPVPTYEHWAEIAQEFHELWNFPNCVGALDGKHVPSKNLQTVVHFTTIISTTIALYY